MPAESFSTFALPTAIAPCELADATEAQTDDYFGTLHQQVNRISMHGDAEVGALLAHVVQLAQTLNERVKDAERSASEARQDAAEVRARLNGSGKVESVYLSDEDALDPEYTARVDRVENETWAA